MKILLSWLLDYLDCKSNDITVDHLVHLFNTRTAEIERYEQVTFETKNYFIGSVVSSGDQIELFCLELNQSVKLPVRSDVMVKKQYLIVKQAESWRWATLADFGSEKEGLMPALCISVADSKGAWRKTIPQVDYILDIDNKSINHRPDLWGHYGIAREVAAFLDIPLKPLDAFVKKLHSNHEPIESKKNNPNDFSLYLQADQACSRVAALVCNDVDFQDSALWMAIRLARVGAKPINAVVDSTNYVMFDIGHPMHVFDLQAFPKKEMLVRMAHQGEKLELLDGQNISLQQTDIVIANDQSPVSLAGVMGGKTSGFQATSKQIVLEAAGFDPAIIRKTAQRYKLRTEASIRFEKHLDPMQNITAIERFVFLGKALGFITKIDNAIISVGKIVEPKVCNLSHTFVEKSLGATVKPDFIQKTLNNLGFVVEYHAQKQSYEITIPTYRMTKDIKIAQDLVEEIIRSYGFENLEACLPLRFTQPFSTHVIKTVDSIKNHLAYSMKMHEVRDYLLYDASFTSRLEIDLTHAVKVRNPLSENWTTLVTSLVPHLVKSVDVNAAGNQHLRFFEFNRIWHKASNQIIEGKSVAGIIFDKKSVDFYAAQQELQALFEMLKIDVVWTKGSAADRIPVYYDPYQVAQLYVGDQLLGHAGMMSSVWMHKVITGTAFIFELNGTLLEQYVAPAMHFKPWSKFQDVCYDISLLVPLSVTADMLKQSILQADPFIVSVDLVDFFEKSEWIDQRALTLRYVMNDSEKTMTKQEIDEIVQKVQKAVMSYGAKIR